MAADVYLMDGKDFFRRKGGNKIEPLEGFRVLLPNGQKKPPLLIMELDKLEMTGDGKWVLFYGPDGRVYTARVLRQDHTFMPPKVPERCVCKAVVSTTPTRRNAKKKKRPRR